MPAFTHKCPNCGAYLTYDPASKKFKCEYCDGVFEEDYLKTLDNEAFDDLKKSDDSVQKELGEDEELVYSCPNCGAQIVTDATTAATSCYYCHNPIVLTGRLAKELRPDGIIPFIFDKKEAKKRFFDWIRKKKYVPAEFVNEKNVDKINGVYYPYWMVGLDTDAHFEGEGKIVTYTSDARNDITTTKYYKVIRHGTIRYNDIERSALKKNDRKLADGIHPYDTDKIIDFEPSYLSGYMAEKRDVEAEEIKESVEAEAKSYAGSLLTSDAGYTSIDGKTDVSFTGDSYGYDLLPAWVLTYKGNDGKMYYYSMNGENGKVCGLLPVDLRRLLIHSSLIGGAVALALYIIYFLIMLS